MLEPQFDSLNTARKGASKSGNFGTPKVGSRKRNASGFTGQRIHCEPREHAASVAPTATTTTTTTTE